MCLYVVSKSLFYVQDCLGALDGTYIRVLAPLRDQPLYRNRKGQVAVNVLGVCDTKMRFVYVLTGWEGSAADAKVLGDAMQRENGFSIPSGSFRAAEVYIIIVMYQFPDRK